MGSHACSCGDFLVACLEISTALSLKTYTDVFALICTNDFSTVQEIVKKVLKVKFMHAQDACKKGTDQLRKNLHSMNTLSM